MEGQCQALSMIDLPLLPLLISTSPIMRPRHCFLRLLVAVAAFSFSAPALHAQPFDYPTADLSTLWTNSPSLNHTVAFADSSTVRALLLRLGPAGFGPSFALGFYCNTVSCDSFLLAMLIVNCNSGGGMTYTTTGFPRVVWSANRDRTVGENATLHFTPEGDLVLRDDGGTSIWSAGTSGKSVAGMTISKSGSLVLFDSKNASIWQSFDHPTDSLLLGQSLHQGVSLTASVSTTNWTASRLYLTVLPDGLYAFVNSTPPQPYYNLGIVGSKAGNTSTHAAFLNGSLALLTQPGKQDNQMSLPPAQSVQYMRLEPDGHLRLYEWMNEWKMVGDLLNLFPDGCAYPTVCGPYGICANLQCSCPPGNYFRRVDDRQPNLGCVPVSSLSCQAAEEQRMLSLDGITYFSVTGAVAFGAVSEESCKQACTKNCSCKAALFQYSENASDGQCYLQSELLSLQTNQPSINHYNSSMHIKVQVIPSSPGPAPATSVAVSYKNTRFRVALGIALGVVAMILLIILCFVRRKCQKIDKEDSFHHVPGMPRWFSFEELRVATENFSKMLGQGGFASVFEGKIGDEKVAVKRLDGIGQAKKDFLAEVEIIGSIHHINLVRLIGFCAEKSNRLLVFEYISNGSLDKWIFPGDQIRPLDWSSRLQIITDIAKGLCYLHEECRQKIAHLDIKPQNILLDDQFNAKVSDFGLSKLIDRDQKQVMTRMRGTPGYLAPEWLTSIITEKADIYSFGIVVMEIICGRRNLDHSQPEESIHLISLLQDKVKTDQLLDLVDSNSDDMQMHREEAMETMKLAMWCLQIDSNRRPSMSTVVKVLEGAVSVDTNIDYNFVVTNAVQPTQADQLASMYSPSASLLSGPR